MFELIKMDAEDFVSKIKTMQDLQVIRFEDGSGFIRVGIAKSKNRFWTVEITNMNGFQTFISFDRVDAFGMTIVQFTYNKVVVATMSIDDLSEV